MLQSSPSLAAKRELLAELLRRKRGAGDSREAAEHPLSFGQRAWWLLHQRDPDDPTPTILFAARVRSPVDGPALQRALELLTERHPMLRTTYAQRGDGPVQLIRPGAGPGFEQVDASQRSGRELLELAAREALRPADLERGPVLRVLLASRAEDDHVLLLALHHIAGDLWSLGILMHELGQLYPALQEGRAPALPPVPGRYADFVRAEAEMLAGPEGERLWHYWRERLDGELPSLALPVDRLHRQGPAARGAVHRLPLDFRMTEGLRRLGADRGTTLFTVLLAAYDTFLYRHTGQRDVLVGSLMAHGRQRPELAGTVGFLDNPVALRTRIAGDLAFSDLLEQARQTVLAAAEHQAFPFSLLVERLRPSRDAGRAPVFQTMLILQRIQSTAESDWLRLLLGEAERIELGGLVLEPLELDLLATALAGQLDLTLTVADLKDRLCVLFQYNPDLFDATTAARLSERFRVLLEAVAAAPEARIADLCLVPAAERHQVTREWNDTAAVFPETACLHGLFEAQAARAPGAAALLGDGESLSYGELEHRANQLAHWLRASGIGPEVRVGVCLEPCAEVVVCLLAVLKAGGAYVPLDPAYPEARLRFLARDAGIVLLLTRERRRRELAGAGCTTLAVEDLLREEGGFPEGPPPSEVTARHLAYVIYTSGSTGEPKGVMIDHRGAVNTLLDVNARFSVGPGDRVFAVSSLSFDLSVYDVFGTLAAGAALVLNAASPRPDPAAWLERLREHRVTIWSSAPPLLEMLMAHLDGRAEGLPGTLRLVMLSGDWIAVSLPGRVRGRVPGVEVASLGGATEASIWSILHPIGEVPPHASSIPYGRPMLNQRFHGLDTELRPVPTGAVGDLYIGGLGVARGYLGRPDLTANRFLPDPWAGRPGARLYRTGDLGRYFPDGRIEFLGRADQQVKIRGYRVELGEIEAQLSRHPSVQDAVVLARTDEAGGRQLVGYFTSSPREAPSLEELRRHLEERLPGYMVPSALLLLDAFPLTPNGKVDRKALPAPQPAARRGGVAPRTPTEEVLAAIFGQVLGVGEVGALDDFFELGGHSLRATQMVSRVREAFGVELSLRTVFEHPILADLAAEIDHGIGSARGPQPPPILPVPRDGRPLPLSFAQERMWVAEQLEPGTGAFNLAGEVALTGALDVACLRRAVEEIVRRHESLRTGFLAGDEGAEQLILPAVAVAVPLLDLVSLPASLRSRELRRLAGEEARRQLDLASPPLLRVLLARLGDEEHALLVVMHHIVSDGWSMAVFLKEFAAIYGRLAEGSGVPLPPLPIQYADFARWQREWLTGEVVEPLLRHWRERLAGAPEFLALPTDRPRPSVRSLRGASYTRLLPPVLQAALRQVSRRSGASLFMTLLAAFDVLLSRLSGQQDLVVGTDIANRNRREIEDLIGFFVNHPVLRADLSGDPTFAGFLDRVRRVTLDAYSHQDLPFERLVQELAPERGLGYTPVFQVLFVLQNVPIENLSAAGLRMAAGAVDSGRSKFDLVLMMREMEEGLLVTWTYSADLFDEATVERMSARLEALLKQVAARPEARLSELDTTTQREREQQSMEKQQRQQLEASKLRITRRSAVDLTRLNPVTTRVLAGGGTRCLVVEPAQGDVDLVSWAVANREFLETSLLDTGAILFRGFVGIDVAEFERFTTVLCPELFTEYGDLPRAALGGRIYTSTPYPPDQWILFHNESSHMDRWPRKQFFHCVQPAARGGETPIADCRRVYERLDPAVREAFASRGVSYVRNFIPGVDVSWQEFFRTEDRAEVVEACRAAGLTVEWRSDGGLRTKKLCPAVARHPRTGEMLFFNQIQAHHISCLDPEVQESLRVLFAEDSLPRNVYFGDGTPIDAAVMKEIVAIYHEVSLTFAWQQGDVILLDNMLMSHSRAPFSGERRIVVAMGDMVAHGQLAEVGG